MKKTKDLLTVAAVYLLAYAIGYSACLRVHAVVLKYFVFDVVATAVTFLFSVLFKNSSVYDPYWSLTPMVMSIPLFCTYRAFSFWQLLFLAVFNLWGLRLTLNWITTFTDFSYEDWRYRKFRDENGPAMWFFINFTGIHYVPTLVVFAGMLPLFRMVKTPLGVWSVFGILIMLFGIALEFFADRQMHAFLRSTTEKRVCRNGLWRYSRHPNYLGEISFWIGVFVTMLPYAKEFWWYGIGALSILVLFLSVSVPMMEKRQRSRRVDYEAYRAETSCLLLLPCRKEIK